MPLSSVVGAQSIVRPGVCTSSTRPASPYDGQVIYETDTDKTLVWNGSGWVMLATGTANAPGLELVKTQTVGTAVSTISVSNAFSSSYENYYITLSGGTLSADAPVNLKLGSSTTGYYTMLVYGSASSGSVTGATENNGSQFSWVGGAVSGQHVHVSFTLIGPNLAAYTKILNGTYQNGINYGTSQGEHRVATAYTDFTLIPGTGTFTGGTVRVYGYKN